MSYLTAKLDCVWIGKSVSLYTSCWRFQKSPDVCTRRRHYQWRGIFAIWSTWQLLLSSWVISGGDLLALTSLHWYRLDSPVEQDYQLDYDEWDGCLPDVLVDYPTRGWSSPRSFDYAWSRSHGPDVRARPVAPGRMVISMSVWCDHPVILSLMIIVCPLSGHWMMTTGWPLDDHWMTTSWPLVSCGHYSPDVDLELTIGWPWDDLEMTLKEQDEMTNLGDVQFDLDLTLNGCLTKCTQCEQIWDWGSHIWLGS